MFAGTFNGTGYCGFGWSIAPPTRWARTELFIEMVEQRYSIGMVAVTRGVCDPAAGWRFAAAGTATAMTFTIVAPPCAVVLATMPPLWSAIANVGRHGFWPNPPS